MPIDQTVASFKEILEGKHDEVPERAFLLKGTIDEVVEASRGAREEEKEEESDEEGEESGSEDGNGDEDEKG